MSHIAVVLTGGTIGQRPGEAGAIPDQGSTLELVESCCPPFASFHCVPAMQRNSPDVSPGDWSTLAGTVLRAIDEGADGVIVLHGTDTMAHTAAALAFALIGVDRPVVLTGSMVPGGESGSDAMANLGSAFAVACAPLPAVCVVFGSEQPGVTAEILPATRILKQRTAGPAAFRSVGVPPLGHVVAGRVELAAHAPTAATGTLARSATTFSEAVDLVKVSPLTTPSRLRRVLEGLAGVVLEGLGAGHVRTDHLDVLREFPGPIAMSTQVLGDAERLGSYTSDRLLTDIPQVIPVGSMTSVAAVVKLSWLLGQGLDVHETMTRDLAGEFCWSDRSTQNPAGRYEATRRQT